jgi:MurNAc alpha-1-phosphate uridylyltransferase
MRAMILAAGRGERLRPLTDVTPKPLLMVHGKPLIAYHLQRLAQSGITDVVINVSHLADQIRDYVKDGQAFRLRVQYSYEPSALETAGGIAKALPLLGAEPFLVISGDILSDFPLTRLLSTPLIGEAHVVLVDNPAHHPHGDFVLIDGKLCLTGAPRYTYAGLGVFHPMLFQDLPTPVCPLATVLYSAIEQETITGEHYAGSWTDVGTVERLDAVNRL